MNKWFWFLISGVVVMVDQVSKFWVHSTLTPFSPVPVMPMLNIQLAYNTGAAFSFLNSAGDWHKWFFVIFSLCMSAVLTVWLWRTPSRDKLQCSALSLILGGALGNLMDRFIHGYVIDFIDVYYKNHHFATFNLADSAICIGASFLFLELFTTQKESSTNTQN